MKFITFNFIFIFLYFNFYSQCNGRYETEIFPSVSVNTVYYSDTFFDYRHQMDVYTPIGDTVSNRPVIIYLHGGAFMTGDKSAADCIDFCTSFAKKGYVAISANYRLATNPFFFTFFQDVQYRTLLQAIADIKAAIRYVRKDYANGNLLGIDPDVIFVGGYSAGAVLSIHLAYVDNISDLPTSPVDVQALVSDIGGTLEGDSGNNGYSSNVSAIVSFTGGINDLSFIDPTDEPIVLVHGTNDNIVNYNCGPGLGFGSVMNLCGMNEMKPVLENNGVLNDTMVFENVDHYWPLNGNADTLFIDAVEFTTNFLFPLLPCNNSTANIKESDDFVDQYPNPAKYFVSYKSSKIIKEIVIYNKIGQVNSRFNVNDKEYEVSLSKFRKGIYYVLIKLDNSSTVTKKLLVF